MIVIATPLTQWDTGRSVEIKNIVATHVHFANKGDSHAVIMALENSQAKIPDYLLQSGKELCVYAVSNGVTIERKSFFVTKRERPENYVYKEDQRNFVYKLITDAQEATEAANQVAQDLLAAKDRGDFNGPKGDPFLIIGQAVGTDIAIDNADKSAFIGMRIFGKTTQDGVPSLDAPVELVSVENPTLSVNEQSMVVPYTLHGIPVSSVGNYTDANGQQWICDEVDFARGVYIHRVNSVALNGTERWGYYNRHDIGVVYSYRIQLLDMFPHTDKGVTPSVLSNYFEYGGYASEQKPTGIGVSEEQFIYLRFDGEESPIAKPEECKLWLTERYNSGNPVEVYYVLAAPIETPLSAEELAAYAALHTYREPTMVSNDAGAYMEIEYVMDAKKYIDGLFTGGILPATVE